jgi:hypothetical protein
MKKSLNVDMKLGGKPAGTYTLYAIPGKTAILSLSTKT